MSKELYGLKILVVDDDQDTRDLLEWVLRRVGAEVVAVPSAKAAMEALEKDRPTSSSATSRCRRRTGSA